MKTIYSAACAAALLLAAPAAHSAAPGGLSYQGTLRKDGRLYSGSVPMTFRITDSAGVSEYWTSGSTGVVVSTGLFRYPLGTPNEAQFALISWKDIVPYVEVTLDGLTLPLEPLYSSAYSMHSVTSERSTGTFTVDDGNLVITGAAGSRGIVFPDGSAQYKAPGWELSGANITLFSGRAGLGGVTLPQFTLDVQAGSGDQYIQMWKNSAGTPVASMTATGMLYADASSLRNLPSGNVVDNLADTLSSGNDAGGTAILNAGAITSGGALTVYSSATLTGALGLSSPRLGMSPGVELSSAAAANYGGVQLSTHLAAAGNVYAAGFAGDGSGLTDLNASALTAGSLPDARLSANVPLLNTSNSFTGGLSAPSLALAPSVNISSAAAGEQGGVLISTNVYLPLGAKYFGDGSGLTGVGGGAGNIVDTLSQTLGAGNNADGAGMNNLGAVGIGVGVAAVRLDVQGGGFGPIQQWRNSVGVVVASITETGAMYGDASNMTGLPTNDNLGDHTATQNLDLAGFDIASAGDITAGGQVSLHSSMTVSGSALFFSTAAFTAQQGAMPGVYVSSGLVVEAGNVGIGVTSPQEKLEVDGGIRLGNSSLPVAGTIRYTGAAFEGYYSGSWQALNGSYSLDTSTALWGVSGDTVYTVGSSSNVAIGTMDAGVSKLRITGDDNSSAANALLLESLDSTDLLTVRNDGYIGVGPVSPQTRLDVQGNGSGYVQFWRNSGGVIVASMTETGILYADAAGIRNLPAGGLDNLGNHILTQNLLIGSNWISSDGGSEGVSVDASGNVGIGINPATARLEINSGSALSGVKFTSFACTGTDKLTADASGNLICASDQTGGNVIDTLSATLVASNNAGNLDIYNLGDLTANGQITSYSSGTFSAALGLGTPRLALAPSVYISSSTGADYGGVAVSTHIYLPAGAKYYGDGSALTGVSGSDNLGDHTATQDLDMAGYAVLSAGGVTSSGDITAGAGAAVSTLSAAGFLGLANLTSQPGGTGPGALYYNPDAMGGEGALYVNLNGAFVALATGTVAGGGGISGVIADADQFSGDGAGAGTALTLKASSVTLQGNSFNGADQLVMLDGSGKLPVLDGSALTNVGGSDNLGDHTATQALNLNDFMLINASTVTAAPNEPAIWIATTVIVGGDLYAAGGASFSSGPVVIGGASPAAMLHVSSGASFSGDMVMLSTGASNVVRMTGGGEIYANKYYGDGSGLTGVSGSGYPNPGDANLDMSGFSITSANSVEVSSRITVGNEAALNSSIVAMIMDVIYEQNIESMNGGVGVMGVVYPTTDRSSGEKAIGGNFIGGIAPGNANSFPTAIGVSASAWAHTTGTLGKAYGIYVQNAMSEAAGTVTENVGVYVDVPDSTGTLTTNTGIHIADQSTFGGTNYNIYSAGANSKNRFEGSVSVGGGLALKSMTKAELLAFAPPAVGELYYCSSGCSSFMGAMVVVSTGTSAGNFASPSGQSTW